MRSFTLQELPKSNAYHLVFNKLDDKNGMPVHGESRGNLGLTVALPKRE